MGGSFLFLCLRRVDVLVDPGEMDSDCCEALELMRVSGEAGGSTLCSDADM